MSHLRSTSALLALSFVLAACGGSSPSGDAGSPGTPGTPGTSTGPAAVQVISGDAQTGVVGTELAAGLVVRVVDAAGAPVSGQVVNFVVLEGGGSIFAGTAVTNTAGQAQERWTLGTAAGAQRLEARAVDGTTGARIVFATFEANALPGTPTQLSVVSGSGQAATKGSLLPVQLVTKVSDGHGNGVQGVAVSFAVTGGSGTVVPPSGTTDSSGQASAAWALGPEAGQQQVEARSAGLPPATFDATATTPLEPVAIVAVTIVTSNLTVGHSTLATAVTRDAAGRELTGRVITWSSSDEAAVIVNASGDVTALSVGSATITATSEGKSGSTFVTTVAPPPTPVATVTAAVADGTIVVGQVTQASAVPRDAAGNVLAGRTVTWTSSAPSVAAVDAAGRVTASSVGTTSIFATCEGQSGSVQVAVIVPPPSPVATVAASLASSALYVGQATQASAVLRDGSGNLLAGRTINWTSSNASVATVNGTTGVVTATGAGSASITATSEGKAGSASMTAALVPVSTVIATLGAGTLTVGQATQASAVLRDAAGNVLTGRSIAWSTSSAAVATVGTSGIVTGVAAGTANITATSEGQTGSASVAVSDGSCAWTPVRTESLATTPAGAIPGGGLAGTQGPAAVGGRTAYASTSDWLALDIPMNLSPSDTVFAVDVDFWVDGIEKARRLGVMIFTDHAVGSSTPYWLNDYGEVHGLWAGLDHAAPPAWNLQWRLPQVPLPASGWGGGDVGTPAFTAPTTGPAAGWHHLRIEGDRSRCEFSFSVDGTAGPSFQGACDPAGSNLTLHHWIPPAGRTGAPVVAFSNLVVSRGAAASCRPWTLAKAHDLTSLPTGAIAKTGGMNGQGPATVAGRTAWLQHSDWNVLEVPTGLTALDDQFAVEVDLYVPTATTEKTTYLNVFGRDAGAPYQFTAGVQVFSTFLAGDAGGLANWEQRTPSGLLANPATNHGFSRNAWHTVRVEGTRSTCRFAYLVDGAAVVSSTLPGCDVAGAYFTLVGGGTAWVASDVAWSNLRVYRR